MNPFVINKSLEYLLSFYKMYISHPKEASLIIKLHPLARETILFLASCLAEFDDKTPKLILFVNNAVNHGRIFPRNGECVGSNFRVARRYYIHDTRIHLCW